jgi:hypothetical protein
LFVAPQIYSASHEEGSKQVQKNQIEKTTIKACFLATREQE